MKGRFTQKVTFGRISERQHVTRHVAIQRMLKEPLDSVQRDMLCILRRWLTPARGIELEGADSQFGGCTTALQKGMILRYSGRWLERSGQIPDNASELMALIDGWGVGIKDKRNKINSCLLSLAIDGGDMGDWNRLDGMGQAWKQRAFIPYPGTPKHTMLQLLLCGYLFLLVRSFAHDTSLLSSTSCLGTGIIISHPLALRWHAPTQRHLLFTCAYSIVFNSV